MFSSPVFCINSLFMIVLFYALKFTEGNYHLKIYKADTCDHSNTTYIQKNLTIKQEGNEDHLYVVVELLKNVTASRNTFWYPMIAAIKPQPDCPNLKKGEYILDKGTMNMNYLAKAFPVSVKYLWKLKATLTDTDGNSFACGIGEGALEQM